MRRTWFTAAWMALPAFGALAGAHGAAAGQQVDAVVRIDHFSAARDRPSEGVTGLTADLRLESGWGDGMTGQALLRLERPRIDESGVRARAIEAFAMWRAQRFDVKLGKQIVAWGRADGVNPTDNLTPRNFRVQSPYEKDQREGVSALLVNYFPQEQENISFFLSPVFVPTRLPLPAAGNLVVVDRQPKGGRWPLGLKFDQRGDKLDWSVSYFRGYQLMPEWQAGADAASVVLHYPKITVFGADAAVNLGRYGWRAELARKLREDPVQAGGARSNWTLVTGIDRNFDHDLNVNLQLIVQENGELGDLTAILDRQQRVIADVNAISFHQERARSSGATMRIGKKWVNGTLEAELLVVGYFHPHTSYWRPLLAYSPRDDVRVTVGAELFSGDGRTYFGSNRPLRGMFAELRYFY